MIGIMWNIKQSFQILYEEKHGYLLPSIGEIWKLQTLRRDNQVGKSEKSTFFFQFILHFYGEVTLLL